MPKKNTIQDLLQDEIKDLYSAETQLTKAIPKMVKGSSDPRLKEAFSSHLKETVEQRQRLEQVAEMLGMRASGKKCVGMEGCIKEGAEALGEDGDENVVDLGIIGAGGRVEHYEMAGYTTAIGLAQKIGLTEAVQLLKLSLTEEQAADKKLRAIGAGLMKSAPAKAAAAAGSGEADRDA